VGLSLEDDSAKTALNCFSTFSVESSDIRCALPPCVITAPVTTAPTGSGSSNCAIVDVLGVLTR
jgi:hypothetical protein